MDDPEKSPFDGFRTIGEANPPRRGQGRLAGLFWMAVAGIVIGGLLGGGAYIGFEFWRGEPPGFEYGLHRRMHEEVIEHPLSEEEVTRNLHLCTLIGAGLGGALGVGLAIKGAPSRERP